jgi:hypothetical protein
MIPAHPGAVRQRAHQVQPPAALAQPARTCRQPRPPGRAVVGDRDPQARYRGSAPGRVLDERIEEFTRDTIATGLRELPGGPQG